MAGKPKEAASSVRIKHLGKGAHAVGGPEIYTAVRHIRVGDRFFEPGETVPVEGRRAQLMIQRGEVQQDLVDR
jgi:hypothetical protein